MRTKLFSAVIFTVLCASTLPAAAADGWVAGAVTFFQNSGQFCDSATQDCSGATYLASEHHTQRPIRDALIEIVDQNGAIIGNSATDANGGFLVQWIRSTTPTQAAIRVIMSHRYGRFSIRTRPADTGTGQVWFFESAWFTVSNGGSVIAPAFNLGDSNLANAYESSFRMWAAALFYVGIMQSRFVNVNVFLPHAGLEAAAAVMDPAWRGIRLGGQAGYHPMTIQHELGHLAVWSAKLTGGVEEFRFCGAYNAPALCQNVSPVTCSMGFDHNFTTQEHRCAGFDEGSANFIGIVASYAFNANEPIVCTAQLGSCKNAPNSFDVERRTAACQVGEFLWELSVMRFMWDLYDTRQDTNYADTVGATTSATYTYSNLVGVFANYAAGTAAYQVNEPFNAALTQVDNSDGRSSWAYQTALGTGNTQRVNNCGP